MYRSFVTQTFDPENKGQAEGETKTIFAFIDKKMSEIVSGELFVKVNFSYLR